ncbi:MAG TPA: hypothetical protein PKO06_14825 [Candidatus Ozemobacteraceae bacterium]|nr:hypothetical protein [Candidatus Ozemobacteraceae bacterium]
MLHSDRVFDVMNSHILAGLIRSACHEIILFTPGIDVEIAQALIESQTRLAREKFHVIVDASEKSCRFGYGTIEGLGLLMQQRIPLRNAPGLRISGVFVDGRGWVFSPTPLLIEAGKENDRQPNALRVSKEQFHLLKQATLGESQIRKEAGLPDGLVHVSTDQEALRAAAPEIGKGDVTTEVTEAIAVNLKNNPPQKFDLARKVNVYNTQIEYVEIALNGCRFQAKKVKLPSEFLIGDADEYLNRNLQSIFNLTGKDSDLVPRRFTEKFEQFRKQYLKPIPKLGQVILKCRKTEFMAGVEQFRRDLEQIKEELKTRWDKGMNKTCEKLIEILMPRVKKNPPLSLRNQIVENEVSDKVAHAYILDGLAKVFPTYEKITAGMELTCTFKAITYETLNDAGFQTEIERQFPFIGWDKLFSEYDAVRGEDLCPSPKQRSLEDANGQRKIP